MAKIALENLILAAFPEVLDVRLHEISYSKTDKCFYVQILVVKNPSVEVEEQLKRFLEKELQAKVELKITKNHCDEDFVKSKISKFFAHDGGYLKPAIERLNLEVKKDEEKENKYNITFYGGKNFCTYLDGSLRESLMNYLYRSFVNEFEIFSVEVEEEKKDIKELKRELRAIEVENKELFVGKIITESAGFICDIAGDYDNAYLAGKVSNLVKRTRKNPPRENARNKNPEFFTFTITDPSGSFNCVMFPSMQATKLIDAQLDGMDCLIGGKIAIDKFGERKMTVNQITKCDIITKKPPKSDLIKEEPIYYTTVSPEPLKVYEQSSFLTKTKSLDVSKFIGKTVVVFDLETTGLSPKNDRIIEIGAVKIVDGEFTEKFSTFINPKMHIPEKASETNNIFDDMVKHAPYIEDVIADFYKFSYGAILCGHNAIGFDILFLNEEAKRCGYYFSNKVIDTMIIAINHVKGIANNRLASLCAKYGIVNENAHRAYEDSIATAKVLLAIYDEYKELEL